MGGLGEKQFGGIRGNKIDEILAGAETREFRAKSIARNNSFSGHSVTCTTITGYVDLEFGVVFFFFFFGLFPVESLAGAS